MSVLCWAVKSGWRSASTWAQLHSARQLAPRHLLAAQPATAMLAAVPAGHFCADMRHAAVGRAGGRGGGKRGNMIGNLLEQCGTLLPV